MTFRVCRQGLIHYIDAVGPHYMWTGLPMTFVNSRLQTDDTIILSVQHLYKRMSTWHVWLQ